MIKIKKAIFPVAGFGTRFLPATKASPKEMMPIVDKPLIQYAVEEAISAGIEDIIFVTSSSKRAIEDHFDTNFELEHKLMEQDKQELLHLVQNILPKHVSCSYIRQHEPLGLGHAVFCARSLIKDEPFAILLADDLIDSKKPCLKQMVEQYQNIGKSVIATQKIDINDSDKYGIVDIENSNNALSNIRNIVEKPEPKAAPSNCAVIGRYILSYKIFDILENTQKGTGGEIQLTDAISKLLAVDDVYAYEFEGTRYDCGSKLGYLQATINYGIKHKEVGIEFSKYLEELIKEEL